MTYTLEEVEYRASDLGFGAFQETISGWSYSQSEREIHTEEVCLGLDLNMEQNSIWVSINDMDGVEFTIDEFMDSVRYIGLNPENELVIDKVS